jgi:hypothetical protein
MEMTPAPPPLTYLVAGGQSSVASNNPSFTGDRRLTTDDSKTIARPLRRMPTQLQKLKG